MRPRDWFILGFVVLMVPVLLLKMGVPQHLKDNDFFITNIDTYEKYEWVVVKKDETGTSSIRVCGSVTIYTKNTGLQTFLLYKPLPPEAHVGSRLRSFGYYGPKGQKILQSIEVVSDD